MSLKFEVLTGETSCLGALGAPLGVVDLRLTLFIAELKLAAA